MQSRDFQTMLIQLREAGCRVKCKRKGSALTYRVYNSNGGLLLTANRLRGYYAINSTAGVY